MKTIIAQDEFWCEESGTRLKVTKDNLGFAELSISCGHIQVSCTVAQFRIGRFAEVLMADVEDKRASIADR